MFSGPRQVLAFVCLPVILICTGGAFAQMTSPTAYDPSRRFSPQELQKDFLIFRKALEESYPGLYRYASKDVMDRNFAKAFQAISKEMTEREFLGNRNQNRRDPVLSGGFDERRILLEKFPHLYSVTIPYGVEEVVAQSRSEGD